MNWIKPSWIDVNMSAEIGAYQDDSGEREGGGYFRATFTSHPLSAELGPHGLAGSGTAE